MDNAPVIAARLAEEIARDLGGGPVRWIRRFHTGAQHFVFDVVLADGRAVLVRLTRTRERHLAEGALRWSQRLRPLGVPLPQLRGYDRSI